eukprot:CAMPEP_0180486754 /NCGR_PEP_ID=MMETSP1036_2-20121128/37160_1 /TAXON_ID=632150 /ORGANISM="Azadinium spinosum, Strain 3D9" /LENGTH=124 /DNA_ID=CAMNT_0022494721 /DNA_START=231 /DNA_END=605 /DNA_ORIENTATION=-
MPTDVLGAGRPAATKIDGQRLTHHLSLGCKLLQVRDVARDVCRDGREALRRPLPEVEFQRQLQLCHGHLNVAQKAFTCCSQASDLVLAGPAQKDWKRLRSDDRLRFEVVQPGQHHFELSLCFAG